MGSVQKGFMGFTVGYKYICCDGTEKVLIEKPYFGNIITPTMKNTYVKCLMFFFDNYGKTRNDFLKSHFKCNRNRSTLSSMFADMVRCGMIKYVKNTNSYLVMPKGIEVLACAYNNTWFPKDKYSITR